MEQRINKAYLLIGGNMGNRLELLARARHLIAAQCGVIVRCSSVYETEAWGLTEQPNFLNQVIELDTPLLPHSLLEAVLKIELQLGRERKEKYGPRLMDIDILLFNDETVAMQALTIPHPQIGNRRFVLTPLAELAPNYLHPIQKITVEAMLMQCTDPLKVYKL